VNDTKNPFESTTIIGAIVITVGLVLRMFDVDLPAEELNGVQTLLTKILPPTLELIGTVMAIVGRFRATKRISF